MKKTVYFRAFEEEDAKLIYKWMNDDELKKLSVGVNRRMCCEEALDWVKSRMRDSRNHVYWAICSKETDEMIGYASLVDIHYINRSAETGAIMIANHRLLIRLSHCHNIICINFIYLFVFNSFYS